MKSVDRRQFMASIFAASTSSLAEAAPFTRSTPANDEPSVPEAGEESQPQTGSTPLDFRYAPESRQTAICFPDDPHKSLVSECGDLPYGYSVDQYLNYTGFFSRSFHFSLQGTPVEKVFGQELASPSIPIVQTRIERAESTFVLTAFATRNPAEGRVDNVIMEVWPRGIEQVQVAPEITILSDDLFTTTAAGSAVAICSRKDGSLVALAHSFDDPTGSPASALIFRGIQSSTISLSHGTATQGKPAVAFFRIPQEGQTAASLTAGLERPQVLLAETRAFWQSWTPFQKPVAWNVGGRYGEFLTASARNILQAREVHNEKLTFQVGPTIYRILYVVDGNFILEAARYLGYDKEAEEGLRTTWSRQNADGAIFAGAGTKDWKDTAIAMFSLVRQCELAQDWKLLDELTPQVVRAVGFLDSVRERALHDGSFNGRYGLLAPGFGDGGLGGTNAIGLDATSNELSNTMWTLAGLKAIKNIATPERPALAVAGQLYAKLYADVQRTAAAQMLEYPSLGFRYLPMLLKEDSQWTDPNIWRRPRPQTGQWALSHTIYPGLVFEPNDPIVLGHARLMQACAKEEIPAETGWARHEAVWTYNAPFVCQVYLWLGMREQAETMFRGFLNHATPQYCWREEQPLRHSSLGEYVGDMPHNWASAECVRFLRHSMALEDGTELRLLAGITAQTLSVEQTFLIAGSPTRFGRLDMKLEPLAGKKGWSLNYTRGQGAAPSALLLPSKLGNYTIESASGIGTSKRSGHTEIPPGTKSFRVVWS